MMDTLTDKRYRSRKFIVAIFNLVSATSMAGYGCYLAEDPQGVALVMGAWGVISAAVLKLYSDANLKDFSEGM